MEVKIFWQENCARCPPAKELGEQLQSLGHNVHFCNVKNIHGRKEAIYHDILSTPSIVITDELNKEIKVWRNITPTIDEVKLFL